jgi:hypothetical protein
VQLALKSKPVEEYNHNSSFIFPIAHGLTAAQFLGRLTESRAESVHRPTHSTTLRMAMGAGIWIAHCQP